MRVSEKWFWSIWQGRKKTIDSRRIALALACLLVGSYWLGLPYRDESSLFGSWTRVVACAGYVACVVGGIMLLYGSRRASLTCKERDPD